MSNVAVPPDTGLPVSHAPTEQLAPSFLAGASSRSVPSLDGLRAISILLVVCLHTLQRFDTGHTLSSAWYAIFNGSSGVYIFFEISGFIITTLLLREADKYGAFSLRSFYLRRAFRILPPLYLYIGVIVALGLFGKLAVTGSDVAGSAFFFHNVQQGPSWSLEHLWSISVEEQFYLAWPVALALCLKAGLYSGRIRAAIVTLVMVLLSPIARVLFRASGNDVLKFASVHVLVFDFIMFGCMVALLQGTPVFERIYCICTRFWYIAPLVMILCNALSAIYQNYFNLTIGFTIFGAACAVFMLWCIRNPETYIGRFLNTRIMAEIGILSYSIYLWQTLFLHEGNGRVFAFAPWLGHFPGNWLGFTAAAILSRYLVEKPFLRIRERIMH